MKPLLLGFALLATAPVLAARPLDLTGEWRFALDPQDQGLREQPGDWKFPDTIRLPGILTAQGFGEKPSIRTEWTGKGWEQRDLFREWQSDENFKMPFFLTPPRHYIGPAWYQREIEVPQEWRGKRLRLQLERVHIESIVWMDGEKIGRGDSLGTPHVFDLTPLDPGKQPSAIARRTSLPSAQRPPAPSCAARSNARSSRGSAIRRPIWIRGNASSASARNMA
jgi:hypothetical protein